MAGHLIAAVCLALLASVATATAEEAPATGANVDCRRTLVVWAWERNEDLRFLNSRCTAVVWFAGQVDVKADALKFIPRQQPLAMTRDQANWPVIRIDAHGPAPTGDDDRVRRADFIRNLQTFVARAHLVRGLQIDFDAPRSWRTFYRNLLADLRSSLPARAPLTMTALASWCLGDPWVPERAVDDTVPMLFEMGPDGPSIRRGLAASGSFKRGCRESVGISLDEAAPATVVSAARQVYVFAPRRWTPDMVARAYALAGITPQR